MSSECNANNFSTPTSFGAIVASSIGPGAAGISISTGDCSVYSPNIPYVGIIPQGLIPGKSIIIRGLVLSSRDKRFTVNLSCGLLVEGQKLDDISLHVDFRFDESTLVLNTLTSNSWGPERRFPNPARRGQAIEIRILAQTDSFNVAVNGEVICEYAYRLALHTVKTLYVKGCVKVDVIQYEQANSEKSPQPNEIGNEGGVKIPLPSPLFRPPVPFTCSIPRKFIPGRSEILITGTPWVRSNVFVINVKCENETALHISVRFTVENQKMVVLNSRRKGAWEKEVRHAADFPFLQGGTFDMVIGSDYNGFTIRVNGRHYWDFPHRLPADTVDGIEIDGDLQLQQVHFRT